MDAQIQFEARDEDETEDDAAILIDVVEAKAMVAGLNPLGEVGDGWIVLCAPVVEGMLVALKQGTTLKLGVGGSEGFVGVCPDSLLVETNVSFGDRGSEARSGTVRRAREGEAYSPFKAKVKCLAVKCDVGGSMSGIVCKCQRCLRENGVSHLWTKRFATVKIV